VTTLTPTGPSKLSGGKAAPAAAAARKTTMRVVWDDHCFVCDGAGEGGAGDGDDGLVRCGTCPKAYHPACLGMTEAPKGRYQCPCHECCVCGRRKNCGVRRYRCTSCPTTYCNECAPAAAKSAPPPPAAFLASLRASGFRAKCSVFFTCDKCKHKGKAPPTEARRPAPAPPAGKGAPARPLTRPPPPAAAPKPPSKAAAAPSPPAQGQSKAKTSPPAKPSASKSAGKAGEPAAPAAPERPPTAEELRAATSLAALATALGAGGRPSGPVPAGWGGGGLGPVRAPAGGSLLASGRLAGGAAVAVRTWVWGVVVCGRRRFPPTMLLQPEGLPFFNVDGVKKAARAEFPTALARADAAGLVVCEAAADGDAAGAGGGGRLPPLRALEEDMLVAELRSGRTRQRPLYILDATAAAADGERRAPSACARVLWIDCGRRGGSDSGNSSRVHCHSSH
jgi:hypothetical protein